MDQTPPTFVYLDNSNIFVSSQSYSSKINNYRDGVMDIQCRINTSILLDIVLDGRNPMLKKAYGNMPKEVKHELDKAGFKVFLSDSVIGEKEIDTKLTADAVEDILIHHFRSKDLKGHNGTLILLSGDRDMLPLIHLARKYEWDVEVWAYENSLTGAFQIETERKEYGSLMEIKPLEKHFKEFVFYDERVPDLEKNKERTILVRFRDKGATLKKLSPDSKSNVTQLVLEIAKAKFRLPVVGKILELDNGNEQAVAIVLVVDDRKQKKPVYNFQTDVVDKFPEFERDLSNQLRNKFIKTSVHVLNLDRSVGNTEITQIFQSFGAIVACHLDRDDQGMSKGAAIVCFQNESSAIKAINTLNGTKSLNNQFLSVRPYTPESGIDAVSVTIFSDMTPPARNHGRDGGNTGNAAGAATGNRHNSTNSSSGEAKTYGQSSSGGSGNTAPPRNRQNSANTGNGGAKPKGNIPAHLHKAYRTKYCTYEHCDKGKCVRAHSDEEIRCYHCGENHFSEVCSKK